MKNKKTLLVMILVFVLLMVGAYVLYDKLGDDVTAEQMIVHATDTPDPTEPPAVDAELPETEPAAATEPPAEEGPQPIMAPDFQVFDKDGNAVRLSEYFGKPIVLNFWASWCGPCQSEMPDFNEKYAELGNDVHFLMINMTDGSRETVESASAFIEKYGYSFPVFFDTTYEAAITYGASSLPTSFFINAQGHVIAQAIGAIDAATLQRGIDMITN